MLSYEYLAGLFDGEGSVGFLKRPKGSEHALEFYRFTHTPQETRLVRLKEKGGRFRMLPEYQSGLDQRMLRMKQLNGRA